MHKDLLFSGSASQRLFLSLLKQKNGCLWFNKRWLFPACCGYMWIHHINISFSILHRARTQMRFRLLSIKNFSFTNERYWTRATEFIKSLKWNIVRFSCCCCCCSMELISTQKERYLIFLIPLFKEPWKEIRFLKTNRERIKRSKQKKWIIFNCAKKISFLFLLQSKSWLQVVFFA